MKKTAFIFSLIAAAQFPALAQAQSMSDDLDASNLPEVDVIFKCHQDAYTMEAAAGGLAGKLAESKERVYGALLYPNDSQFAFVAAPYKVSGPAFFEQDGVKFACVTVQSVKSLSEGEPSTDPVVAPEAPEAPEAPTTVETPSVDDGSADAEPTPAPVGVLPDFSGIGDGNVLAPLEPIDAPEMPADAIPSAEGDDGVAGVPKAQDAPEVPVLAPIYLNPNTVPELAAAEPSADNSNVPTVAPEPAPAAPEAPAPAPAEEAPLAAINLKPTPEAAAPAQEVPSQDSNAPLATDSNSIPAEAAPFVMDSNAPAIVDAANTPIVVPVPAEPTQDVTVAPVATDSNSSTVDVAPIDAAPVASNSNSAPIEAAPVASNSNTFTVAGPATVVAPAAGEPNDLVFSQPLAQEANTPIVVPEAPVAAAPADQNTLVIPNAPEAPFSLAPEANNPNSFDPNGLGPVSFNPNVAVIPIASETGSAVAVGQDINSLDPNGVTPSAIAPVLTKTNLKSDLVSPVGEALNADELDERRNAAFWANFDD